MSKQIDNRVEMVEMGLIDEPEGVVRLEIDQEKIVELSESIKAIGQLQPILIRPRGERYEIVFGHRRFMAVQRLGKARIMALVKEIDDEVTAIMRATENIAREDLTLIEEAAIYKDLKDRCGLRIDQIGEKMGKSSGLIKRRMDLLRMPDCLQKAIHKKQIGQGISEELWRLGDGTDIEYLLMLTVEHGASYRVVRDWVKEKLDERRRNLTSVGEGVHIDRSPMELKPTYYSCDICTEAVDLNKSQAVRICPVCHGAIMKGMGVTK